MKVCGAGNRDTVTLWGNGRGKWRKIDKWDLMENMKEGAYWRRGRWMLQSDVGLCSDLVEWFDEAWSWAALKKLEAWKDEQEQNTGTWSRTAERALEGGQVGLLEDADDEEERGGLVEVWRIVAEVNHERQSPREARAASPELADQRQPWRKKHNEMINKDFAEDQGAQGNTEDNTQATIVWHLISSCWWSDKKHTCWAPPSGDIQVFAAPPSGEPAAIKQEEREPTNKQDNPNSSLLLSF